MLHNQAAPSWEQRGSLPLVHPPFWSCRITRCTDSKQETQMAAHITTGLQIWTIRDWSWKNPHDLPRSERKSDSSGRMALVWFWFLQEISEQAQIMNSAHHPCVNSWLRGWAATSLGAVPAATPHFSCFQNTLRVSTWVFVLNAPSAGCCVN